MHSSLISIFILGYSKSRAKRSSGGCASSTSSSVKVSLSPLHSDLNLGESKWRCARCNTKQTGKKQGLLMCEGCCSWFCLRCLLISIKTFQFIKKNLKRDSFKIVCETCNPKFIECFPPKPSEDKKKSEVVLESASSGGDPVVSNSNASPGEGLVGVGLKCAHSEDLEMPSTKSVSFGDGLAGFGPNCVSGVNPTVVGPAVRSLPACDSAELARLLSDEVARQLEAYREREKRKLNVVAFGMEEGGAKDKVKISRLFHALRVGPVSFSRFYRLGKRLKARKFLGHF